MANGTTLLTRTQVKEKLKPEVIMHTVADIKF